MDAVKYTPGPWEIAVERGSDIYVIPQGSDDDAICRVNGHAGTIEIRANARLIAAAPELLGACQACATALAYHGVASAIFRQAEAAIAKALGQ